MDTRNGRIYDQLEIDQIDKKSLADEKMEIISRRVPGPDHPLTVDDKPYLKLMKHHPTPRQRARRKVGRNDVCPCGSGIKFKKCCLFRG